MKEEFLRRLLEEEERDDDFTWLKSMVNDMYAEPQEEILRSHTGNFTDPIESGYGHYGMETFEIGGDEYAIALESEMDDNLREYYQNLVDDIGWNDLGIDLTYYVVLSETNRRMMADEDADNYVYDLSDEEILELSGEDSRYEELETELSEDREKLEELKDEIEELTDDDEIEELEVKIEELEDKISVNVEILETIIDDAREALRDTYYEEVYDCLEDPINCLVDERGWYSSAEDMVESGIVDVDTDAIVDDFTSNGSYGDMNSYDGEYSELQDSTGEWWVIMQVN